MFKLFDIGQISVNRWINIASLLKFQNKFVWMPFVHKSLYKVCCEQYNGHDSQVGFENAFFDKVYMRWTVRLSQLHYEQTFLKLSY